jgi:hypothetical protein
VRSPNAGIIVVMAGSFPLVIILSGTNANVPIPYYGSIVQCAGQNTRGPTNLTAINNIDARGENRIDSDSD